MNLLRLSRAAMLGVSASVLLPAFADAQLFRLYDPASQGSVTYDTNRPTNQYAMPAPQYQAQVVNYSTAEAPGTIVVDTQNKFLYFVLKDQMAIRYGIGVGREGYGWTGTVKVGAKKEWPTWTPPAEMIKRRPELVEYASGMPGGPQNPLGARALYLYDDGRDTMYRIHGTNEPWTIGYNVSSGCIRMLNAHVTELYRMAKIGAKVIVM